MLTKSRPLARLLIPALLAFFLATACNAIAPVPTKDASASNMLPNVAGYTRVLTKDFQGTLANTVAGGAALTGQVPIAGMVKLADGLATCYQNAGAYDAAVYYSVAVPPQAGAIIIINNRVVADPKVLLSCLNPSKPNISAAQDVSICSKHDTLAANNNTYEIYYVASDQSLCSAFESALASFGSITGH